MEYLLLQNNNLKQIFRLFTESKPLRPRHHPKHKPEIYRQWLLYFYTCCLHVHRCLFCVFRSTLHRITQVRKPGPGPQADGSKWLREPKPAKRQQRQHSPFSLCFTSPCSTMGDIMQLVEHLIKAGFCFPVWQDKLLHGVNLETVSLCEWPLCQPAWSSWVELLHNVCYKLKIRPGNYL